MRPDLQQDHRRKLSLGGLLFFEGKWKEVGSGKEGGDIGRNLGLRNCGQNGLYERKIHFQVKKENFIFIKNKKNTKHQTDRIRKEFIILMVYCS